MTGIPGSSNRYMPRVQPGGDAAGGAELMAVADIAALAALPTAGLDDGAGVNVRSVLDQWQLDKTSPLAPDGITIVAALGGGNWIRLNFGNETWRSQATWHINELTGDDENVGSAAGTALETWVELMRRVGTDPIRIAMTVNIDSDLNQDIDVTAITDDDAGQIFLQGAQTVIYSGTLTGVQAIAPALANDGQITDVGIPVSWTASGLNQQLVKLTSGANIGAVAWVMRDLGGKTARHNRFYNEGAGVVYPDPAIGDDYDVVTLTQVNGRIRGLEGGSVRVTMSDLYFIDNGQRVFSNFGGLWTIIRCNIDGLNMILSGAPRRNWGAPLRIYGTRLRTGGLSSETATVNFYACFIARALVARGGNINIVSTDTFFQYVDTTMRINLRDCSLGIEEGASLGLFDVPGGGPHGVWFAPSYGLFEGLLWGTGNAFNYAIRLHAGATVYYENADKPTLAGAVVADVQVGNTTRAYADIPYVNLANLAQIVDF